MEDEEDRATLPKEDVGRGNDGGGLTTSTGKKAQREDTEESRVEGQEDGVCK